MRATALFSSAVRRGLCSNFQSIHGVDLPGKIVARSLHYGLHGACFETVVLTQVAGRAVARNRGGMYHWFDAGGRLPGWM